MSSYISRALQDGHKILALVSPQAAGDVDGLIKDCMSGTLHDSKTSQTCIIHGGEDCSNGHDILSEMLQEAGYALSNGWPGAMISIDMKAFMEQMQGKTGIQDFIESIRTLDNNKVCTVLCMYDRRVCSLHDIMKAIPAHPWIIVSEELVQNIYYHPTMERSGEDAVSSAITGCLERLVKEKRRENELRELDEKYRFLFENTSDFLFVHDMEGYFREINLVQRDIEGYTEQDLVGLNLRDLMPKALKHGFDEYLEKIKKEEKGQGLLRVQDKDGTERIFEYKNILLKDESGPTGVRGLAQDITDRFRAKEALKKSEQRYRDIFNNVSDFLYFHDLEGGFEFKECNLAVRNSWNTIGGSRETVNLKELIPERFLGEFPGYLKRIRDKGQDEGLICAIFNDGKEHILEYKNSLVYENDVPVGVRGSARDITENIQAQRSIRKSEEKYRTILESIEEGYYEVDLNGYFRFSNDSLCRILGCSREELLGVRYSEYVGEKTAEEIFRTFNQVFEIGQDVEAAEWEFIRKEDSQRIYIEVSVSRIMSKNGKCKGFRGIVRDVTKRVQAERALSESEQRYRLLAENIKDLIWTSDLDLNFTYLSPSVKAMTGATVEEALQLNIRHVMNKETFKMIRSEVDAVLEQVRMGRSQNEKTVRLEFEHTRSDGTTFWADVNASVQFDSKGEPIGFVGITRDVTDKINAENERKKNEMKYHTILESIEEGYYEVDMSGRLIFFNDTFYRMIGYSKHEMIGMRYRKFMDRINAKKVLGVFSRVFSSGRPEMGFGWEFIKKDGSRIQVESSVMLMKGSDGEPAGFRGVLRDVTQRKQGEELKAAMIKAEAENRAKSEFLANMSHEIRTPLNGIIGMAELALDTPVDENQRSILNAINRESDTLLNLINDILDFSKIEAEKLEFENIDFDLRVLIEDLASSFAIRSEKKGLEFFSFLSPEVPAHIIGDPGRLRQVLTNLASNALKFTGKGDIFIKAEMKREFDDKVEILFTVRDTGIGIPIDKQDKIFESFTQADGSTTRKYGGTGLGLTISKRIVEVMGGQIGVTSSEGHGSTFWFTAVFEKQQEARSVYAIKEIDLGSLNVLIVDDNETNRYILMEYLKTWGCRAVESTGGEEALSMLAAASASDQPFDLILMDFHMPGMDGFELTEKIREMPTCNKVPIILLTSMGEHGDSNYCRAIGIQGYLPKPTRRDDLRRAIVSVMGLCTGDEGEDNPRLVTRHTIAEDFRKDIRILLAEDYPTNQQVALRHLQKAGYHVDIAENGQLAVAACKRRHYDLILMDIQMPVMDGYSATVEIRRWEKKRKKEGLGDDSKAAARIPIIAMTAHAIMGYRDKCMEVGMDDYLAKPLRREELLNMVDKWVKAGPVVPEKSTETPETGTDKDVETMPGDPPIDYKRAMDEFECDDEFLRELLEEFIRNVKGQIQTIQKAITDGNAEKVRTEAHSIKGGAANLTADDLAKAAYDLEMLGKSGDVADGAELLERLETELVRVESYSMK
ncbi:MAG: PAS domain S-box protein [Deltaproteobacteria bacterium]|nr:PAS domain S-box protein [Deltaproteobacteria bacterium]